MTTAILSYAGGAIGGAVAGPVGAAVGSAVGAAAGGVVDQQILKALAPAQVVQGNRLGDRPQPTAAYGVPIARLGGVARLACPLMWIADQGGPGGLREEKHQQTEDGVKRIWYQYYASFAVLIGRGPIAGVKRIWLNGELVYDADRFAKPDTRQITQDTAAKLTIHSGTDDQARDGLIESFEGTVSTPAYRGWAYLVFDDLRVDDKYGSRIPEVQVEFVRDGSGELPIVDGPTPLHAVVWDILADAGYDAAQVDLTQLSDPVRGYARAAVAPARSLIEELQLAYGFDLVEVDGTLKAVKRPAPLVRPEHQTRCLISEHGLIVNAYHDELGRGGYFHPASGTSEGQFIAIAAFLHANQQLAGTDPSAAQQLREAAELMAGALETTLYRRTVPADSSVLFVPHWLFAAREAVQLQSVRTNYRARFAPAGGNLRAVIPPGPGHYGEGVVDVFQVYADDGSYLLWDNPYSAVIGTSETLVDWNYMDDATGTEVIIAGSTAKDAVIVYAANVGPVIEAGQPYEAWPVWRKLGAGEVDCAADTLYWAMLAFENLETVTGASKWADALAATKQNIIDRFRVDDGRDWFQPQPVSDAFSLSGTFESSTRDGMTRANWSRNPATGTVVGAIPAGAGEAQIGRGRQVELTSASNTIRFEGAADIATGDVWLYLDTAQTYSTTTRFYARLNLTGDGADLQGFELPLTTFYRRDNGDAPGGGLLPATTAVDPDNDPYGLEPTFWTLLDDGYTPAVRLGDEATNPSPLAGDIVTSASTDPAGDSYAALTVEARVQIDHAGDSGLVIAEAEGVGTSSWDLYVVGGWLSCRVHFLGASTVTLNGPALDAGKTYWAALTADPASGDVKLYLDGAEVASGNAAGGSFSPPSAGYTFGKGGNVSLGAYRVRAADVRVWSALRAPGNLGAAIGDPAAEADLLHYWPMNEGGGDTLNDAVPSGDPTGTLAAESFPLTIYACGVSDAEPTAHTLYLHRTRPNPPIPLDYAPWVTPFTINTQGNVVIGWRGLPGTGYQAPELWRLVGGAEGPSGAETQCRFLKDAQDANVADGGARGPLAHCYVWPRADKAELGDPPDNTWIYTWHDPNSFWGGYQYRPIEATARLAWKSQGDAGYDAARVLAETVTQDFLDWLDGVWPNLAGSPAGPPTNFPGPPSAPTTDYEEPHFAAIVLRAAVWGRLANLSAGFNATCEALVSRAWTYLETLHQSSGPMAGTWSPDPASLTWYGFWHAEIVDALALLLGEGASVAAATGIAAADLRARLAASAQWIADNTRQVSDITPGELGAQVAGAEPGPPYSYTRQQESEFPREVGIKTLDPDLADAENRSYARRLTTQARAKAEHDLPVVMETREREQLARKLLYAAWARRERYAAALARDYLGFTAGDVVVLPVHGTTRRVQVERLDFDPAGLVTLEGFLDDPDIWRDTVTGSAGAAPTTQVIKPPVSTVAKLLDLPILDETDGDGAAVIAALYAGDASRWDGAALHRSLDGGASYEQVGSTAVMATAGAVSGTPPAGPLWRFDRGTTVTVTLTAGSLESKTEDQILADETANLCVVGAEVLQFTTATLISAGTYELSGLLRGLRGTEEAVAAHGANETFVLFDYALLRVPLLNGRIGVALDYKAVTSGQTLADAANQRHTNAGLALAPRAPAHLAAHRDPASGDWSIGWRRRTRLGGGFAVGSPAPLAEESEAYELEVLDGPGGAVKRTVTGLSSPSWSYGAADQVGDFGSQQTSLTVRVYQVSAVVGRGFAREGSW